MSLPQMCHVIFFFFFLKRAGTRARTSGLRSQKHKVSARPWPGTSATSQPRGWEKGQEDLKAGASEALGHLQARTKAGGAKTHQRLSFAGSFSLPTVSHPLCFAKLLQEEAPTSEPKRIELPKQKKP